MQNNGGAAVRLVYIKKLGNTAGIDASRDAIESAAREFYSIR